MSESIRVEDTVVWFLELEELRPAATPAQIALAEVPLGPLNQLFYDEIGRDFHWTDKSDWTRERWQDWAARVETWIVYDRGTPAGYAELGRRPDSVEIETFGLLEPFRGKGLGGALLTTATQRAIELAPTGRVTVNTCELDGPHARANYEARGFRLVHEEIQRRGRREA